MELDMCDGESEDLDFAMFPIHSPCYNNTDDILSDSFSYEYDDRIKEVESYRDNDVMIKRLEQKFCGIEQKFKHKEIECKKLREDNEHLRQQMGSTDLDITQSKWCRINVGGFSFESSLADFTRFPATRMAELFSNVFVSNDPINIARDGKHFRHILNYLRSPELFDISRLVSLSADDLWELKIEAVYYGLFEGMFPGSPRPPVKPIPYQQLVQSTTGADKPNNLDKHEDSALLEVFKNSGRVTLENGSRGSARLRAVQLEIAPQSEKEKAYVLLSPPGNQVAAHGDNSSRKRESISPLRRVSDSSSVQAKRRKPPRGSELSRVADAKRSDSSGVSRSKQKSRKDADEARDYRKRKKLRSYKLNETGGYSTVQEPFVSSSDWSDFQEGVCVLNVASESTEPPSLASDSKHHVVLVRAQITR